MLSKLHLKFKSFLILLLFSTYAVFGMPQEPSNSNLAHIGIDKTTELSLENNWAFYWNQLITPNNFTENDKYELVSLKNWTNFTLPNAGKLPSLGYATYRKTVTIAKNRVAVSLYIPKIYAASKVFINGKFISEIGVVGKTKEETLHRRFSQIIPLNTNETTFEIVIQVANFYHQKGGISEPIIIGDSQHLYGKKIKLVIADMIFIGCLGFIGFFFLFFFLLYWNKDHAVIYFAIMCISLSYMALSDRYAPLTQVFETISWVFLTKIEYISLFLGGTAGSLFFNDIFKRFSHKLYAKLLKFVFYILALLVIFLPAPHFTKLLLPFLVLMILNLCYVGFVIVKAILAKRYESILLLISMLLGSVIFTIHIFFFLDQNQFAIIFVNFGYVVVFLLLSMLLMTRFSRAFKQLERSRALALKQKQEITTQSDKLSAANLKLEENLILLENYNTELDDFNHIVSHDLKSPLVSVYSLASFIEEDLKDSLDENTKNHIHLLKGVVSKMEALINGLLQYSKVAKGNKTKTTFSLNKLLTKVVGVVDYQNKSTIIVPEKDLEICANETELNHVFQNLISNAIKHNDKEKAIIKISVTKHAKEYLFTIKDNGPGIEAQYHDKIFKIFSQLKLSDDVESTGVGLAIVKKIITQNKGIITLSSEKEKGLTLQFTWAI